MKYNISLVSSNHNTKEGKQCWERERRDEEEEDDEVYFEKDMLACLVRWSVRVMITTTTKWLYHYIVRCMHTLHYSPCVPSTYITTFFSSTHLLFLLINLPDLSGDCRNIVNIIIITTAIINDDGGGGGGGGSNDVSGSLGNNTRGSSILFHGDEYYRI